jgi:SPP1 gp7 family putative phage head morphogenesis protein
LHKALQALYESDFAARPAVGLKDDDKFKPELKKGLFQRLTEWIHRNKGFNPEHLDDPEPYEMIKDTYRVISKPLHDIAVKQEVSPELTSALEQNAFMFSGFKIFHESNEMASMLKGDDGGFKSYDRFEQDVLAIDESYNHNYLRAEYNFAANSTLSAVRWQNYAKDGDRYNLQYRTALDERVREEHRMLEGITLPPSDKFWDKYYPPNGWNCRCTVVQVLKDKYPTNNSDQACASGERATTQIGKDGSNKAAIFRFNPGKSMKLMPPKHPYLPKGCGDCSYNKLAYNPNSEKCQACKSIREIEDQRKAVKAISIARNKAISSISDGTFKNELLGLGNIKTGFLYKSRKSIKTLLHHSRNVAEIETAMSIIDHLDKLEFVRTSYLGEGKNLKDPIEQQKIQKKIDRGVVGYNIYYYRYHDRRWVVKTEVSYRGDETLYSFTKKP